MPLLTQSNQNRPDKVLFRALKISNEAIKTRAARIAGKWSCEQRSERKRLGTAKRDWLFRLINISSNNQE